MRIEEVTAAAARDHGLELVRFGYQLTHDHAAAEDLVQDAMALMLRRERDGSKSPINEPVAYARTVMIRRYTSVVRLHRYRREVVSSSVVAAADRGHDQYGRSRGRSSRSRVRRVVGWRDPNRG